MYSRDLKFGDGMTEIHPLPEVPEIQVFDINTRKRIIGMDIDVPEEDIHQTKYLRKRTWFDEARDYLLIGTVLLPIIWGMIFATVMVNNTWFYCSYWIIVMSWTGIFGYLCGRSKRRPHRSRKTTRSR